VFKDGELVTFDFLLDLKGVNVFGEALNLSHADGIDETCLTDTISADQTVFMALGQTESTVFDQMVSTDDNCEWQNDVLDEVVSFFVSNFGGGHLSFLVHKGSHLKVHGKLSLVSVLVIFLFEGRFGVLNYLFFERAQQFCLDELCRQLFGL
jgi:hypothetical protein